MLRFLDPTHGQAATIPTDRVIPLRLFDDLPHGKDTIFWTPFLFNDVLDPSKLRDGLEALATFKGWDKIGARLRYNRNGRLYYHIPASFTKDRPAVNFCNIRHDMPVGKHPVASQMQSLGALQGQGPEIVAEVTAFKSLWDHPSVPHDFSAYLKNDLPQTGLVVVSFHDATIVVLSWFHTFFDIPGKAELLHAWSKIVNDNPSQVGTPHDADEDPLTHLGLHHTEPYVLEGLRLTGFPWIVFAIRTLYNAMFKTYRTRVLRFPAAFLHEMRQQVASDLSSSEGGDLNDTRPFLSDDNLITAWWARLHTATRKDPRGTVNIFSSLGIRKALQDDLLPSSKPYLSNAFQWYTVLVPAQEVITSGLSHLASLIRKRVTESRTRQQVEAYSALVREKEGTLTMPVFGDATMTVLMGTSWCHGKLFDLNLTGAVVKNASTGVGAPSPRSGFPSYVQYTSNYTVRLDYLVTVGKDHDGNYWLNAGTDDAHWERIERNLCISGKM